MQRDSANIRNTGAQKKVYAWLLSGKRSLDAVVGIDAEDDIKSKLLWVIVLKISEYQLLERLTQKHGNSSSF